MKIAVILSGKMPNISLLFSHKISVFPTLTTNRTTRPGKVHLLRPSRGPSAMTAKKDDPLVEKTGHMGPAYQEAP